MKKAAAIVVALLASCGEADPLPSPATADEAGFQADSLFLSSAADAASEFTLVVLGLPGTVSGQGQVFIAHKRGGATITEVQTAAAADGGFAATLVARVGDELEIRFKRADGQFSMTVKRVVSATAAVGTTAGRTTAQPTAMPPAESDAAGFVASTGPRFTTSAPDALGVVTVQGADMAPGLEALIAVPARASTARAVVDSTGRFTARLRGDAGDTLHIFTRDPATGETSPTASQIVPPP